VKLPIRVRLTAWYAALLTAILVVLGSFVVLQLGSDLQTAVDRQVRDSTPHIAQAYSIEGPEDFLDASRTALPADGVAQVLTTDGRVLHSFNELARRQAIAPPGALAQAIAGDRPILTAELGRNHHNQYRVLVMSIRRHGVPRILAVGESLAAAHESGERVLVLLLLAGPAALIATALGGWWLARKALLPVGRMTTQAGEIGIDRLHDRVEVPAINDEVGQLAITLNAMLDRLEQGVREKHRLIGDASHELRTPLAVMRAEIDVALRRGDLDEPSRVVLESAREEVDRMSRTVDNLLTLAQVDEGRLELLTSRVNLLDAIEVAARPLRPLAAAKDVELTIGGEGVDVDADPQSLGRALTNLIENAIKFTQRGGAVHVVAWHSGDEVGVTVADNGPGMPAAATGHVFDRFYRVDSARGRTAGGSGLGLAICREVATAHGGRVWVNSEEGKGSEFSLALPVGEFQ
jgi:heavy metal sensor kinase